MNPIEITLILDENTKSNKTWKKLIYEDFSANRPSWWKQVRIVEDDDAKIKNIVVILLVAISISFPALDEI